MLKEIHARQVPAVRSVEQRQNGAVSIRALAGMMPPQTLPHSIPRVFRPAGIAARERPEAFECSLLTPVLLLLVALPGRGLPQPLLRGKIEDRGQRDRAAARFTLQSCFGVR